LLSVLSCVQALLEEHAPYQALRRLFRTLSDKTALYQKASPKVLRFLFLQGSCLPLQHQRVRKEADLGQGTFLRPKDDLDKVLKTLHHPMSAEGH